jgi:hypothetical protein
MKKYIATLFLCSLSQLAGANPGVNWDPSATTAAATGYCLAKHPYASIYKGQYTADGFETVASPGVVGAVRRNYIANRESTLTDEGNNNSCEQACVEFGKTYPGLPYTGASLKQKIWNGKTYSLIASGLGDLGSLVVKDHDFYLNKDVTAGMSSRGNSFVEGGVGQSDYCCCQAK